MKLNEIQVIVEDVNKKFGWDSKNQTNPYEDTSSLAEEVGELFREVRKYEQRGVRKGHNDTYTLDEVREELVCEIGDVLASITTIANRYNISLEEAVGSYREKMNKRKV